MSDAKAAPESGRYYSPTTGALVADATATDAKREGYYPSITTLKYELAEPWNLRQSRERLIAKTAALTDDPGEFADEVSWQDEMRTDAVAEWRKAAQRGTDMHAADRSSTFARSADYGGSTSRWMLTLPIGLLGPGTQRGVD